MPRMRASLRVHDGSETPSTISLKQASTIAEIRNCLTGSFEVVGLLQCFASQVHCRTGKPR